MSGFDRDGVDKKFFAGTADQVLFPLQSRLWRGRQVYARAPRACSFDEACKDPLQ